MIKQVEIQNWKTHLNSKFEFGKGTNVLVGSMGSGKTSVMDAICFALFGTFPALQQRRIGLQEILMRKPSQAEEAVVKLGFDYEGKEFEVERTIKLKGSSQAKLYIDGKFVAGPKPQDVNSEIEKNVEISYNLFSRAVYSEQNQIDYFLRLSPGQRKEKFDELLELDRYEKARSNAVSALNRVKGIVDDKKRWLQEQQKDSGETALADLKKRFAEKGKLLEDLKKRMLESEKEITKLEGELKKSEEAKKEFDKLNETVSKKGYLAQQITSEIKAEEKELGGLPAEAIEKSAEEKGKEIETLEKLVTKAEKEEKQAIEKVSALKQEMRGNELKISELGEQSKQVKGAGAECPVCKTELDKIKKESIAKENAENIAGLEGKNKKLQENISALKVESEKEEKGLKITKQNIEKLEEQVGKLDRLLEISKKMSEKQKQAKELEKEVLDAKEKLSKLGFNEAKAKKTRDSLIRTRTESESNKREQASAKEVIAGIERELDGLNKKKEQVKVLEVQVKEIEERCEKMMLFVNSLKETQAQLRETLIETINEAMDSIWPQVYPYKDYSSAKMSVEKGSYELVVKDSTGEWVRVEGILSGGERSSAAICIRIAFSLVLTRNLSWIILDEPTHNLDGTAVSALSTMLREKLPSLIEQVFVITHDKEMEKAASGTLHVLERDKENDKPTNVEQIAVEN